MSCRLPTTCRAEVNITRVVRFRKKDLIQAKRTAWISSEYVFLRLESTLLSRRAKKIYSNRSPIENERFLGSHSAKSSITYVNGENHSSMNESRKSIILYYPNLEDCIIVLECKLSNAFLHIGGLY